jgi:hypothetical protein
LEEEGLFECKADNYGEEEVEKEEEENVEGKCNGHLFWLPG